MPHILRQPAANFILPLVIVLLIGLGWYATYRQNQALSQSATAAYQQTQLEIVRAIARSIDQYVADELAENPGVDITQIEQKILHQFVAPVRLLTSGDAWIYAPDHIVFDLSSDLPAEYRGRSIAEIFALQQASGASHYQEMTAAVSEAREGVGWYIWLPEKGVEVAAWTPVRVGSLVWSIGLSTPLPEILQSTGATTQMRSSWLLMTWSTAIALLLLLVWLRSATRQLRAERSQREAFATLERLKADLEAQVAARTAELVATNYELQTEIAERMRTESALLEAKDSAEIANRAKSTFLANMSHELRTPLTAIIGYSDLIQMQVEHAGHAELLPDIGRIAAAGQHLLSLISDLLDISKIEAGKMELALETFDVSRMIDGVVASVQPLVDRNQNVLRIERAPDVGRLHADATKVRQILVNLLSNAAKFTERGTITLRAHRAARLLADGEADASVIVFEVADTGIGIAPDQFERIFDAFAQARTPSTYKMQGTGLGLAISRHYSRMMGGDLTVVSQPGVGSIFTVTLPASVVNHGARPFYAEL